MDTDLCIERFAYTPMGTFGRCYIDGQELFTVERPWLQNERSISCIPEGTYQCAPRRYNKGGYDAIEVQNVPNRSFILIHKGNTMHDLAGCIAITSKLGVSRGLWAGLDSKTAFGILMEHFGTREFTLEIKRYEPRDMSVGRVTRMASSDTSSAPAGTSQRRRVRE